VFSLAPFASNGLTKAGGRLVPTVPGAEASTLDSFGAGSEIGDLLRQPGAVILAGERLATSPGAFSAVARLAEATGAHVAWVPRRSGDRGAVEAGALGSLLPGGRPVADPEARAQVAAAWGVEALPGLAGRDTAGILAAISSHQISSLVVAGVDADDLGDPSNALVAFSLVDFLVSIEVRASEVTERAHVVFPVPAVAEKSGTFLNWEGRMRPFVQALHGNAPMTDLRVLAAIADEMDRSLGLRDNAAALRELQSLGRWTGTVAAPSVKANGAPSPLAGEAVLASWNLLLDLGRMQDGEPHLARTARRPVARLSPGTAHEIGASDGGLVVVTADRGTVTLPLAVTDMPDRVVWLPTKSPGSAVRRDLGVDAGAVVRIHAGGSF
jgi:NADH-quinone oxidoreductase subunit G